MVKGAVCDNCRQRNATIRRPKNGMRVCKECFYQLFETEIHETIIKDKTFVRGQKVAIGASGGKDSTTLAYVMALLNKRYDYGLNLYLLSIDEGIIGYRDGSLETVKQNAVDYGLPLEIYSYKDLFGYTMDEIVSETSRNGGNAKACSYCGVFRRQALNIGASKSNADIVVTGHNADDNAETVLMNLFRGDINRLTRQGYADNSISLSSESVSGKDCYIVPRGKPLRLCYQKEIVLYAHFKKLLYFSIECTYSKYGYRGNMRQFLSNGQLIRPDIVANVINSSDWFIPIKSETKTQVKSIHACDKCGYPCSQCCTLLDFLDNKNTKDAYK